MHREREKTTLKTGYISILYLYIFHYFFLKGGKKQV